MSNAQHRILAFAMALIIFAICAVFICTFAWGAISFISLAPHGFPWTLFRVLIVVATVLALCFACSDEALD